MNASTAHHLLKTLHENGYLELDGETHRYRIGIAAAMLGSSFDTPLRIADAIKAEMDGLHAKLGGAVVAAIFENGSFKSIYWKQEMPGIVLTCPVKTPIDKPHLMACGQILLAWRPEPFIEAYAAAAHLPALKFKKEMKEIVERKRVELRNPYGNGAFAIGLPVFDFTGRLVISIGWSVESERWSDSIAGNAASALDESAGAIERRLDFNKQGTSQC